MGQATTFVMILTGLLLVFYIGGLIDLGSTPNSLVLSWMIQPEELRSSPLFTTVIVALQALAVVGVFVGFVTGRAAPELAAMTPVAIWMFNIAWDFIEAYGKVAEQNQILAVLVFAPLLVMYLITVVDFWRGKD